MKTSTQIPPRSPRSRRRRNKPGCVICWHLLAHDCDYDDLGGDWFTRRNTDRQRDRLIQQLAGLGYYVTLNKIV
jgi:hypothetical protein